MTSRDLDDKAIVRRKPEAPQIRLIRQAKQRVKLGLDFEGVTLESLAKDMPELKAGRIEEAVIVQLNQYFQQLGVSQPHPLYSLVMETADIIDTWVYRVGLVERQYSLGTAVGLLRSIVGIILMLSANKIAQKVTDYRIF